MSCLLLYILCVICGNNFIYCSITASYFWHVTAFETLLLSSSSSLSLFITFMRGIYNYIHATNYVSRVCDVAAVLYWQFVLHVVLFRPWNMFCTVTLALPAVYVQCPIWPFFCSSLILWFLGMLLRYCLSDFEMVPVTSITCAFTFHMRWTSIIRSLYFKIFSASFLNTHLFPGIAASINMHVPSLLLRIMTSGLLLGIVLSVCTCWFHNLVTLLSWLTTTTTTTTAAAATIWKSRNSKISHWKREMFLLIVVKWFVDFYIGAFIFSFVLPPSK